MLTLKLSEISWRPFANKIRSTFATKVYSILSMVSMLTELTVTSKLLASPTLTNYWAIMDGPPLVPAIHIPNPLNLWCRQLDNKGLLMIQLRSMEVSNTHKSKPRLVSLIVAPLALLPDPISALRLPRWRDSLIRTLPRSTTMPSVVLPIIFA